MYTSRHLFLISLLALPSSFAQQSGGNGGTTVPSSLASGFTPDAIQLQVSYTGDSANGFDDGSTLQSSATSQTPVFALGDASGVSTVAQFTVMMLDTTDPNNLALHFLQAGFKADGDKTGIESTSQPLVKYAAPGAFGEKGQRQYSFLLYQVNGQGTGNLQGLPQGGAKFDVSAFQSANALKPAKAGVAMKVDLGGGSGNGNGNGNTQSQGSATSTTATVVSNTQSAGTTLATSAATGAGNGNTSQGGSSATSSFGPVTFQSPSINSGSATSSATATGGGAAGGASTSAAGGAAATGTASQSAGAGGAGASGSAGGSAASGSAGTSASASGIGSSDAAGTRYLSGVVVGLIAVVVAGMVS